MKVLSKVGAAQEHVRKALDIKSSIESTVSRIHKLNIVNDTQSRQLTATARSGKCSIISTCCCSYSVISHHIVFFLQCFDTVGWVTGRAAVL